MGLIARELEAAGIATVSLTSARDITASVNPPRAAFLDYPLGHTSGRAEELGLNTEIVLEALTRCLAATEPGQIVDLGLHWAGDDTWKDSVMRSPGTGEAADDRAERFDTPQFQTEADQTAAAETHEGADCVVCPGIDY